MTRQAVKATTRVARGLVALVMLGTLLQCGGDNPTDVPPVFVLELTSPGGADGAILFEVTGGSVTNIATLSSSGGDVFHRSVSATTVRVAFVGTVGTGALLNFQPGAGAQASDYSVTVIEVADRNNDLRDVSGYAMTVTRRQ